MSWFMIVASISLAAYSGNASAQDNDLAVPRNAMEIGGFSYSEGRVLRSTDGERVVDLFAYPDRRSPRPDGRVDQIFFARSYFASRSAEDRNVLWIDGRACPRLYGVLTEFNNLESPRLNIPNLLGLPPVGADTPPPPPVSTEARVYSVWGRARQPDGTFAHIKMEAYSGLLADWVRFARSHIAACWTEKEPALPGNEPGVVGGPSMP